MKRSIILGLLAAAVGTNVAMKLVTTTGGSVTGLGLLAAGSLGNAVSFLVTPFWNDLKK